MAYVESRMREVFIYRQERLEFFLCRVFEGFNIDVVCAEFRGGMFRAA